MWTGIQFIARAITLSWFSAQYHHAQHDENEASRLQGMTFTNVSGIKMLWLLSRPPRSLLTIRITNPGECHGSTLDAVSYIVEVWIYFWKYFLTQIIIEHHMSNEFISKSKKWFFFFCQIWKTWLCLWLFLQKTVTSLFSSGMRMTHFFYP